MYSFHLATLDPQITAGLLLRAPTAPGLRHVECLAGMRLGAPVVSPDRLQLRRLAVFARWQDEAALETFLDQHGLGRQLAGGWHVRMEFLRRWGRVSELSDLPQRASASPATPEEPVVAVTLARMRLPELPRFLHWGRPVERLVRDHPGATLAMAAIRPLRTVSTFSVWRTTRDMVQMVHGHSGVEAPVRHRDAMVERERRDFHHEFTTLRFRPLSEHGRWEGRTGIVPCHDQRRG
ncbi:MAG: hypothetical protein L0G99_08975 [Propionibacteriales bacterium]|nr:hypothetical protein [Propionibacteriales bacterium]